MKLIALPAVLFLLALPDGCSSGPVAPSEVALELDSSRELDFSWEEDGHGEWLEEPEVETTGGVGTVAVEARLSAPNPCQELIGEGQVSGEVLELEVTVRRTSAGCVAVIGTFGYTAEFRGVPPSEHRIRVVHRYPDTGWPSGPVLEETVTVR